MASAPTASTAAVAHPPAAATNCAMSAAATREPSSDGSSPSVHSACAIRHAASASSPLDWSRATS
eukprot:5844080-Pleurochrysis_carterae.AAC.1